MQTHPPPGVTREGQNLYADPSVPSPARPNRVLGAIKVVRNDHSISTYASGLLNLVPYLGAVLAWLPPFMVGMAHWKTIGPYVGVATMLSFLHMIGLNVLMPAIVGRRVHLNALAVTIALLFWGWLWGAIGLILAIPITATIKVVCDHVEGWEPAGRWLGE